MAEDDVGLPLANQARDGAAVLECRLQLAVVNVEHLGGDAEDLRGCERLLGAPPGQRAARFAPVPDVAVGDRDELDLVSERRPFRRRSRHAQLVVVGMRPERDDPKRCGLGRGWRGAAGNGTEQGHRDQHDRLPHTASLTT